MSTRCNISFNPLNQVYVFNYKGVRFDVHDIEDAF